MKQSQQRTDKWRRGSCLTGKGSLIAYWIPPNQPTIRFSDIRKDGSIRHRKRWG